MDNRDPWLTLSEALIEADARPTLLWGDGIEHLDSKLREDPSLAFFTHDVETASTLNLGVEPRFCPEIGPYKRVILRMPSSKEQLRVMLDWSRCTLPAEGECWVFGHRREGIRSVERLFRDAGHLPRSRRIKRRTRVISASYGGVKGEPPTLASVARDVMVEPDGLSCVSLPGLFSHGRLDPGTERLIAYLKGQKPSRHVYDLGCGYGAIGLFLAKEWPKATVSLCDRSLLAVLCARTSASRVGLGNAHVEALSAGAIKGDGQHDLVVSNPPFHLGRETRTDLIEEFAEAAKRLLKPGGRFVAVANQHLPYGKCLEKSFQSATVDWEDKHYRIWLARP